MNTRILLKNWIAGPRFGRGKVGSRRGKSEGAELEGEIKRGGGVEWLKPMCEGDRGVGWQCGKKILLGRKVFLPHCQHTPPITLTHRFMPLHPFYSSPTTPHLSPPPHPELIRNQQQSVRRIKGRSGS